MPFLFPLCLILIVLKIFDLDRDTLGVYFLMYGGSLAGACRIVYPFIPIYGLILNFIGLFLLRKWIRVLFKESGISIEYMLMVIIIFLCSYIYATKTPFATSKMIGIVMNGFLLLPAYLAISSSSTINNKNLYLLLTITSISYIAFLMTQFNMSGSITDFSWLRRSFEAYCYANKDDKLISYQEIGMTSLYGFAFLLCHKDALSNKTLLLYAFVISFFVILISGARQSLLGLFVIVFLKFTFFNDLRAIKKSIYILITSLILIVMGIFVLESGVETVSKMNESGIGDREFIYLESVRIFNENLIFGVGLGGFGLHTNLPFPWPHNMILEILCETGIFGALMLLLIIVFFWIRNKNYILYISNSGISYYLLVFVLLIRVMVSSHLAESVEVFSAIFVISYKISKKYNLHE